MKITRVNSLQRQRGVAMLATTLMVLVAMTVMTGMVARMTVTSQRMAANTGYTEAAFQAAEAEVDNALAYLNHNRTYIASTGANGWLNAASVPKWSPCNPADVTPPCGDGSINLYDSDWYRYGPVPNLAPVSADHTTATYLLSENIADSAADDLWLGCLNLSVTSIVVPAAANLLSTVNGLLGDLGGAVGLPGLGLPDDLCLPLNFNGANAPSPPSSANPTIRAVAVSNNTVDARGGAAVVQQDLQTVSRFVWEPMAPLMVDGTPHLFDDIRIWGNPRPPSRPPYDWSILDLNDVAGLNVTALLGNQLTGVTAGLDPDRNLTAVDLAPLLNLSVAEVLALDINVTFPLSIWSDETAQLKVAEVTSGSSIGFELLDVGRTCMPQFGGVANPTCLPLSISINIAQGTVSSILNSLGSLLCGLLGCPKDPPSEVGLHLKLPDVQDPENLLSTITDLLDTSAPVDFPDDLFAHLFGVSEADKAQVLKDAVLLQDCSDLHTRPGGFYRLEEDDCDISGIAGSAEDPMLVVVDGGDASMAAASEFYGVLFMLGPDNRRFDGASSGVRPTLHGALLSTATTHLRHNVNLVYDRDAIRRAGYRAGHITRLPGGWNDTLTGP